MAATTTEITEFDEPLTPAGRLFLQPPLDQVINCALTVDHPINVSTFRTELENSDMLKHPRFTSLMVTDSHNRKHWRKTDHLHVDSHLIIINRTISSNNNPTPISNEDAVNEYISDLTVSSPLPTDKPLWEIHLLTAHNAVVFRVHHSLGDGISLMSMLLSCCRRAEDETEKPSIGGSTGGTRKRRWRVGDFFGLVWYSLLYVVEFCFRGMWLKDGETVISGGDGVEMWPRKLATARFKLDDMKIVKGGVKDATINDVLFGVISSGLSRYLDIRSPKALPEGLQITGVAMVNLRPQAGLQDMSKLMDSKSGIRWGNKFGMMLLPVYYHKSGSDPMQFVKRSKAMIDKKKLSLEAPFSYNIGKLVMSLFGPKRATSLTYRLICNTTFTISNIVGPREEITIAGNPVKSIRVTSSSLPHAITMHMVSYAGVAYLQILAAKEIIPDPKVLARCFEDALLEMKKAAETTTKS